MIKVIVSHGIEETEVVVAEGSTVAQAVAALSPAQKQLLALPDSYNVLVDGVEVNQAATVVADTIYSVEKKAPNKGACAKPKKPATGTKKPAPKKGK